MYLSCSIPKRVCQCGDQRSVANVLWQEGLGIKHQLVHFPSFGRFLDQSDLFRLVYAKKFDTWTKGFTFRSILLNMPTKPTKEWEHCVYLVVVPTARFSDLKKKHSFASNVSHYGAIFSLLLPYHKIFLNCPCGFYMCQRNKYIKTLTYILNDLALYDKIGPTSCDMGKLWYIHIFFQFRFYYCPSIILVDSGAQVQCFFFFSSQHGWYHLFEWLKSTFVPYFAERKSPKKGVSFS